MKILLTLLLLIPSLSWGHHNKEHTGDVYKSTGITTLHQSYEPSSKYFMWIKENDEIVPLYETVGKMTNVIVNGKTGWMLTRFISGYELANEDSLNKKSKKLDIKNQCLDFGFTEGTENFANCQLQLTILEKQSNNSNQITNDNSQNDYMKQQNEILQKQLETQQKQLDLAEREKNKKVWNDFMDAINPKPKLNCRNVGINTVCY